MQDPVYSYAQLILQKQLSFMTFWLGKPNGKKHKE